MGYCEERFAEYQKRKETTFRDIYNKNTNEGIIHLTGMPEQSAAWRYAEIHGATELMGGWANLSYWIKNHARNYFRTCEKLLLLTQKYARRLPKEERERMLGEIDEIMKEL